MSNLGLISGVSKWGIFVELVGNKCEGMVSLKQLADDFYYPDEDNNQVIGQRYGHKYKLGDRVKIKIIRVDISKKQMDFVMVENEKTYLINFSLAVISFISFFSSLVNDISSIFKLGLGI